MLTLLASHPKAAGLRASARTGQLLEAAPDGGTSQGLVLSVPLDGGSPSTLVTGLGQPGPIAAGSGVVLFASQIGNTSQSQVSMIQRMGGTPYPLATSGTPVYSVALDSTTAYWSESSTADVDVPVANGGIASVPLTGGSPKNLVGGLIGPGPLVVLGSTLFYATGGSLLPSLPSAGIWSIPTAGGSATALVSRRQSIGNFVIDATRLAWVDVVDVETGTTGLFVMSR